MGRIREMTRECFDALVVLRRAEGASGGGAEALHAVLRDAVDAMMRSAGEAGLSSEEAGDLAYPVVALADEIAMARDELRQYWSSRQLQVHYFNENVAGEAFFTRLSALRKEARNREIVHVYYLALLLGFQGRYRVRGGDLELMTLTDELAREVARESRHEDVLAPRAERPEESRSRSRRSRNALWVALAVTGVCGAIYLGLYASSSAGANAMAEHIAAIQKR